MSSTQEKLDACASFISSCPSGEVRALLKELEVLFPGIRDESSKDFLKNELKKYNEDRKLVLDGTIISADSLVSGTTDEYLNTRTNKKIKVDHVAQEVLSTEDSVPEFTNKENFKQLDKALQSYCSKQFALGEKTAQVHSCVTCSGGNKFVMTISAVNRRYEALWGGAWTSRYEVDMDEGSIKGQVCMNAHYFEKGTVQLNHQVPMKEEKVDIGEGSSGVSEGCEKLVAKAAAFESEVHQKMLMAYAYMDETTMKDLRRIMPVTGNNFDWSGNMASVAKSIRQA